MGMVAHSTAGLTLAALSAFVLACSSGSPRVAPLSCLQHEDSDVDVACRSFARRPRKLDCESEQQALLAIDAGCLRERAGTNDMCCPTMVFGTTLDGGTRNDGGAPARCTTSYAGTWTLTGSCAEPTCAVSQSDCTMQVSCANGTSLTGTLAGNVAELSGESRGVSVDCTATFDSRSAFSLSCGLCSGAGVRAP